MYYSRMITHSADHRLRVTGRATRVVRQIGCCTTVVLSACKLSDKVCPADLRIAWSPQDTTIAVGQMFTAKLALFACAGTKRLTDTITWRAQDTTVAAVDSTSGLVRGVRPGRTIVFGSAHEDHVGVPVNVTVR